MVFLLKSRRNKAYLNNKKVGLVSIIAFFNIKYVMIYCTTHNHLYDND